MESKEDQPHLEFDLEPVKPLAPSLDRIPVPTVLPRSTESTDETNHGENCDAHSNQKTLEVPDAIGETNDAAENLAKVHHESTVSEKLDPVLPNLEKIESVESSKNLEDEKEPEKESDKQDESSETIQGDEVLTTKNTETDANIDKEPENQDKADPKEADVIEPTLQQNMIKSPDPNRKFDSDTSSEDTEEHLSDIEDSNEVLDDPDDDQPLDQHLAQTLGENKNDMQKSPDPSITVENVESISIDSETDLEFEPVPFEPVKLEPDESVDAVGDPQQDDGEPPMKKIKGESRVNYGALLLRTLNSNPVSFKFACPVQNCLYKSEKIQEWC